MLVNPVFQHIRIASTNGMEKKSLAPGLYRSTDGRTWFPLRGFNQRAPVFTIAQDGILFVEDKVSFDNGEHFTTYVHWGALFEALKREHIHSAQGTKIKKIEPFNNSSKQLILEIDIGLKQALKLYTPDRGESWALLRR